jgi:hypothetical protein
VTVIIFAVSHIIFYAGGYEIRTAEKNPQCGLIFWQLDLQYIIIYVHVKSFLANFIYSFYDDSVNIITAA